MSKRQRYREPAAGTIIKWVQAGFSQIAPADRDGTLACAMLLRAVMGAYVRVLNAPSEATSGDR